MPMILKVLRNLKISSVGEQEEGLEHAQAMGKYAMT